jgi:hypothetical protein
MTNVMLSTVPDVMLSVIPNVMLSAVQVSRDVVEARGGFIKKAPGRVKIPHPL